MPNYEKLRQKHKDALGKMTKELWEDFISNIRKRETMEETKITTFEDLTKLFDDAIERHTKESLRAHFKIPFVYCMYANRHDLPENEGAIFDNSVNPFEPIKNVNYETSLKALKEGADVHLYVTGATPSLIVFLQDVVNLQDKKGSLYLLQFNKDINDYFKTKFV